MHPVDVALAEVPVLLNDFFRHLHSGPRPKAFLCGKEPEDRHFDLRFQVKRLLDARMGCTGFLGEDIEELGHTKADTDHLTIEVKEAVKADLIVMFLGSAGTISELTAFVLDKKISPKILVFNDVGHQHEKSFINRGPLKLIGSERVVFYDPHEIIPSQGIITQIDFFLAREWYGRSGISSSSVLGDLSFEAVMTLFLIHALFPIRWVDLLEYSRFKETLLTPALKSLFELELIETKEKKYLPTTTPSELDLPGPAVVDIGKVRMSAFNKRLSEEEVLSDYRLIL